MSKKLVADHGFVHLSAGDLLRAERDSGSPDGELINTMIAKGEIVPVAITVNLLKKAMQSSGWTAKKFLIDGFPRNQENKDGWRSIMDEHADMKFVLFLDCSEQSMIDRVNKRAEQAAQEGAQQRIDDNMETLKKRFKTF